MAENDRKEPKFEEKSEPDSTLCSKTNEIMANGMQKSHSQDLIKESKEGNLSNQETDFPGKVPFAGPSQFSDERKPTD